MWGVGGKMSRGAASHERHEHAAESGRLAFSAGDASRGWMFDFGGTRDTCGGRQEAGSCACMYTRDPSLPAHHPGGGVFQLACGFPRSSPTFPPMYIPTSFFSFCLF